MKENERGKGKNYSKLNKKSRKKWTMRVQNNYALHPHYILQLQKQLAVQSPISIDRNIKLDALHQVLSTGRWVPRHELQTPTVT